MKYWIGLLSIALLVAAASAPALAATDKALLAVSSVTVTPEALMPGDHGMITVTFAGTGDAQGTSGLVVRKVTLSSDGPVSIQEPSSFDSSQALGPGATAKYSFTIAVDPTAGSGLFYPKLTVGTSDGDSSLVYQIPVRVSSDPARIILSQVPASVDQSGEKVVLDVVNQRPIAIDCASVVPVGDQYLYKPVEEYYIGSIGPGESYTVEFDVRSRNDNVTAGPSFMLKYKNGDNWHESSSMSVPVDQAAVIDDGSGVGLLALIVVILATTLLVGGIFVVMRRKRSLK